MNKPEWKDAPKWADRALKRSARFEWIFGNGEKMQVVTGKIVKYGEGGYYDLNEFEFTEMRHDPWKEGEERMAVIPQNGNDGEHYEEVDNLEKQPRYTDEDGLDWIDEFAANNSIEDFRAAMRFTIGKYDRRLGKKDELSKELYKISDYYQRWSKIEKELESK
tara:strand:+ start:1137 stop:1625 length:489 start_codon:yes stop_codon:yes gene_type:complete